MELPEIFSCTSNPNFRGRKLKTSKILKLVEALDEWQVGNSSAVLLTVL